MLTICLHLEGEQLSQWDDFGFNSFVKVSESYFGAKTDGIFQLDEGEASDQQPIDAFFELPLSDWGVSNPKRVHNFKVGYEANGRIEITFRDDEGREQIKSLDPIEYNFQHGNRLYGRRDMKGRYWMVRIDNVNGCDFSIDQIEVTPVICRF
jgi:hypothetical protein